MKRKTLLIVLCLLLLCSCQNKTDDQTNNTTDNINIDELYFNNFATEISYTQKNCDDENCMVQDQVVYRKISVDTNISKLTEVINKINANVDSYYQKAEKSKLSQNDKCGNYTGKTNYGYNALTYIFWNIDDNYIFLTQKIEEANFCTSIEKAVLFNTYIYDRKTDKILTQKEYLAKEGIEEQYLLNSINYTLEYRKIDKTIKSIDEVTIFKIEDSEELYFTFLNSNSQLYATFPVYTN